MVSKIKVDMDMAESTTQRINFEPWRSDWTATVLSIITEDEKIKGNPKVDGLRRAAWNIFEAISTHTTIVQSPNIDNGGRAVVVVDIKVRTFDKEVIECAGSADVFSNNCEYKFAQHATAVAETRAEGRALRKLMCLTKVLAAEEVYGSDEMEQSAPPKAPTTMISSLNMMCSKLGINPLKLANYHKIYVNSISDITRSDVLGLTDKLVSYSNDETSIPKEIK